MNTMQAPCASFGEGCMGCAQACRLSCGLALPCAYVRHHACGSFHAQSGQRRYSASGSCGSASTPVHSTPVTQCAATHVTFTISTREGTRLLYAASCCFGHAHASCAQHILHSLRAVERSAHVQSSCALPLASLQKPKWGPSGGCPPILPSPRSEPVRTLGHFDSIFLVASQAAAKRKLL
jgi:hypothetical protein